jgi:hypothetical protein
LIAEILSGKLQFTEDTVKIISKKSGSRGEFSMTSKTGANGRYVLKGEWSPDSKFFVFSTFSSEAHSSWNFRTFVYSVDSDNFLSLDDKIKLVTDEGFRLTPPHILKVQTLNPKGIDFPSVRKTIDLMALFPA